MANKIDAKKKASELVQEITDKLFDAGHTINKPMVKLCATIVIDKMIEAAEDCSVVKGYPLDEYAEVRCEIKKI